ncbi:hypothetical protein mRhiFer1_008083 [Rhinolophus ferrumequinum]|uniref:Uncharacterized protein n=1 Tax=Rhinolophus ferrumequinum TaxID=59479 RepID=A0A7J7WRK1_RHIFE|nr:hypothetical protein mRhiFer1_008083 [Rhinolophus ferrumequinum]
MGALDSIPKEAGEQEPGSTWLLDALRFRTPAWTSRRLRGARGAVRSAEWGRPRTRAVPGRDLHREFHISNGQVRRNAGGCSWQNSSDRVVFVQSHNNQLRWPRWASHPAHPAGGPLRGPPSFSRLELGDVRILGRALQLRINWVCSM